MAPGAGALERRRKPRRRSDPPPRHSRRARCVTGGVRRNTSLRPLAAAAARGGALFLGGFVLLGLVAVVRGRDRDLALWLVDLRDVPEVLRVAVVLAIGMMLVAWALGRSRWLRPAAALAAIVLGVAAARDALRFWDLVGSAPVRPMLPIPLSAFLVLAMAGLALAAVRLPVRPAGRSPIVAMLVAAAGWALVFPLFQMFFFGTTDYRRPADAAVVFGARVYANGQPSPLLGDRIRAAVDLYRAGLVPLLVMSGGDGTDGHNEASVMRDTAIALGVPATAIEVDPDGVTTEATVANTLALISAPDGRAVRILAVSQAYHLPRVKLAYQAAGADVFTVPTTDLQPIGAMPLYVLREVPAFWSYLVRDCLF
jgi:vancomycin permeability regulator SanA